MSELLGVTDLHVPYGAEYLGSLDPTQITSPDFSEPKQLDYLANPLKVFRQEFTDGSTRYDVISDHEPLNGDQLLGLLDAVAPFSRSYDIDSNNISFQIRGVIGDWDILDRKTETKGYVDYLLELHKNLGGPWQEFVQSQPTLIGLLYDVERPTYSSEFAQL